MASAKQKAVRAAFGKANKACSAKGVKSKRARNACVKEMFRKFYKKGR